MKWLLTVMLFININKCVDSLKDEFNSSAIHTIDRVLEKLLDTERNNCITSHRELLMNIGRTVEKTVPSDEVAVDNILGVMLNSEESEKNASGWRGSVSFWRSKKMADNATLVDKSSKKSKNWRNKTFSKVTLYDEERRRSASEETKNNKVTYKRRSNNLGKKLALKPLLRKYRLHKGRFNKRFSKNTRKFYKNDSVILKKNLIKTLRSLTDLKTTEVRKKRCNKFDVFCHIRVPDRPGMKLKERETNRFVIDKFNIPHEVSVDRGNTAWSVRIKNFKNMNVNSDPGRFHVDTHYSNLKFQECRRKKRTTCADGTPGETTPQYSLNFCYDTDNNETQIKVCSLERTKKKKKTMVKKVWDEICPDKQKSTTCREETRSTTVGCGEVTTKVTDKETADKTTEKFKTDKIAKKFKWNREKTTEKPKTQTCVKNKYDAKSSTYALVSCLGLHGDSQYFNRVVPLKETAL